MSGQNSADRGSISPEAMTQLFTAARTHNGWIDREVPDDLLRRAIDLAKWGPTSANCSPMRVVFVRSPQAKKRLAHAMSAANLEKTMVAPATAIVAYDLDFYEHLPSLYPATDARAWFVSNEPLIEDTAFRNGSLQAAYFLMALRALGLDAGPMSGFDNAKVDAEFFSGTRVKSNFLINIGYGDAAKLYPRGPRFAFEEIAKIL